MSERDSEREEQSKRLLLCFFCFCFDWLRACLSLCFLFVLPPLFLRGYLCEGTLCPFNCFARAMDFN